jgi:hypothetical protein
LPDLGCVPTFPPVECGPRPMSLRCQHETESKPEGGWVVGTCMPRAPCFYHMRLFFREIDLFVGAILLDRCRWALRPRQTNGDAAPNNPRWGRPG